MSNVEWFKKMADDDRPLSQMLDELAPTADGQLIRVGDMTPADLQFVGDRLREEAARLNGDTERFTEELRLRMAGAR